MRKRKFVIYLIFWFLYAFSIMADPRLSDDFLANSIVILQRICIEGFAFFLTTEWLVPKLVQDEKNYFLWLIFLMSAVFISWVDKFSLEVLSNYVRLPRLSNNVKYIHYFLNIIWIMFIALGISLFYYLYERKIKLQEEETLRNKSELSLLRYKINPHFLFNTLNNLYSFCLSQPDTAAEMILKLSGLMRYLIYHEERETTLEKELQFIQDYVSLEVLRLHQKENIRFEIEGNTKHLLIPPMLLLPFVENCFKHCGTNIHEQFFVNIRIKIVQHKLHLLAENSKKFSPYISEKQPNGEAGFGLSTVKRRLQLLYGDERYKLHIQDSEHKFRVDLFISLQKMNKNEELYYSGR
jgi:hypothetical protein